MLGSNIPSYMEVKNLVIWEFSRRNPVLVWDFNMPDYQNTNIFITKNLLTAQVDAYKNELTYQLVDERTTVADMRDLIIPTVLVEDEKARALIATAKALKGTGNGVYLTKSERVERWLKDFDKGPRLDKEKWKQILQNLGPVKKQMILTGILKDGKVISDDDEKRVIIQEWGLKKWFESEQEIKETCFMIECHKVTLADMNERLIIKKIEDALKDFPRETAFGPDMINPELLDHPAARDAIATALGALPEQGKLVKYEDYIRFYMEICLAGR